MHVLIVSVKYIACNSNATLFPLTPHCIIGATAPALGENGIPENSEWGSNPRFHSQISEQVALKVVYFLLQGGGGEGGGVKMCYT